MPSARAIGRSKYLCVCNSKLNLPTPHPGACRSVLSFSFIFVPLFITCFLAVAMYLSMHERTHPHGKCRDGCHSWRPNPQKQVQTQKKTDRISAVLFAFEKGEIALHGGSPCFQFVPCSVMRCLADYFFRIMSAVQEKKKENARKKKKKRKVVKRKKKNNS